MLALILGQIGSAFVGTIIEKVIDGFLTYFERASTIRQARDLGIVEGRAAAAAEDAVVNADVEAAGDKVDQVLIDRKVDLKKRLKDKTA